MSNKDKLKPWQDNLFGFIGTSGLLLLTIIGYNTVVYEEGGTTRDKTIRALLKGLDDKFGKEYVLGFLILLVLISGFSFLRSYSKKKKDKNNDNQS